jgi:hypothetical protein
MRAAAQSSFKRTSRVPVSARAAEAAVATVEAFGKLDIAGNNAAASTPEPVNCGFYA